MAAMSAEHSADTDWTKVYVVLLWLCISYFGKYFCTSDMYIVETLFMEQEGITSKQLSSLFAVGYFTSMFGKICAGALCDKVGGRVVVLLSVCGYSVCTILFSLVPTGPSAFGHFFVLWSCIGFFALGLAWVSVVAVATDWIPQAYLGRLMGFVSMAPQLGDAMARLALAPLLFKGWRTVFRGGALISCVLTLPLLLFVPRAPLGSRHDDLRKGSLEAGNVENTGSTYTARLRTLLGNPFLWILCLLSGSLYGTRTLFLLYSADFLAAAYCCSAEDQTVCLESNETVMATANASACYTLFGCISVMLVGWLKDKLPARHRAAALTVFVAPLFVVLAFLSQVGVHLPFWLAASLVALIGFCLFGPYKVLGAVFAVDVGGKEMKSTCTACMGVFDNLFAMIMLLGKGAIGEQWSLTFSVLSGLSLVSLVCAAGAWQRDLHVHVWEQAPHKQPLLKM